MSEASLAAQRLAVVTLRDNSDVTALVPAANIFDRAGRPEVFPCVIFGEATTAGEDTDCHDLSDVYMTVHVWTREQNFTDCKTISGAIRRALRGIEGVLEGFSIDFAFESANYLRDPDGQHMHGVLTFIAYAEEF